MNRAKKEEKRKYDEARKGLTVEQVKALNKKDNEKMKIEELARSIHAEKFPEEYDFMYDSFLDKKERESGINPMNKEYIDKINSKRAALGVSPLSESGLPNTNDTMTLCIEEARKEINNN